MVAIRYNIDPNWHDIKQAYENDDPDTMLSVPKIAQKFHLPAKRIYNRAKRDKWERPLTRTIAPQIQNKNVSLFVKNLIARILKEYETVAEVSEWYKDQRAMLLRQSQISDLALLDAIRNSITEKEMKSWSPAQKARWFEVLSKDIKTRYEEERLEEDQSTENVSVIYKHILGMQKRDAISAGR